MVAYFGVLVSCAVVVHIPVAYAGAVLLESKVRSVCVRGGSVLVLFQDTSIAFYRVCPAAEASEVMHYVHRVRHALANGSVTSITTIPTIQLWMTPSQDPTICSQL